MPNLTTNYQFKKPLVTESADIAVLNANFDGIDEALTPTVSQATSPTSASTKGKIAIVIGWLANRIKAITGKANWWETPATNLQQVAEHIGNGTHPNATQSAAGFMSAPDKVKLDEATPENVASKIAIRDVNGRIRVGTPVSAYDAVNKTFVDTTYPSKTFVEQTYPTKTYADSNYVNKSVDTTMSAKLTAQSNVNYTTRQVRNIVIWTSGDTPPSTSNGDILIKV